MRHIVILLFAFAIAGTAQPDAANDFNNRGLEAYGRGDYAGAERLYRQAIPLWQALGDPFTAHLGITHMNLGQALAGQGRRPEAAAELRESIALMRPSLGIRHLNTLTAVNLLAGVELVLGQDDEAGALLEEALPIERELYPGDVQLARTLAALACLRIRQLRLAEALPLAEEALTQAMRAAGKDSLDTALAYATVAEVHRIAGRPARALPLYRHAHEIYRKHLGPQHPRVASMLAQEALILIGDGKLALAERQLREAQAIINHSCPNCLVEQWGLEADLGVLRARQGKYAEADRLLTASLDLLDRAQPQPTSDLAATMRALALVRRREHRFEEADRLDRRAASLSFR
ncbi:MAG TPA: tetratricopeptide repeat protein [Bryobacteraceae bacterium]|jgi:tetratricopeptide (TPR) repeat protein|nr:tetratricopeptide repeat protein [Bryobacteraceae bacterium]